jgi:hypothetical protein
MLVTTIGNQVHVTLSRTNVRQLQALLEQTDRDGRCLARRNDDGMFLLVHVEDDADHYERRGASLGVVQCSA